MKRLSVAVVMAVALLPFAAFAAPVPAAPMPAGTELWRWNGGVPQKEEAFDPDGLGGEGVAIRDLGNDGVAELIVGAGVGAPSSVRTLRADGSQILSFSAFDDAEHGGVRVAAGDLDGDGKAEIVAATGAGPSGRVRVFDGIGTPSGDGFLPYGDAFHGGIALAVGDFNGDGTSEIATLPASGGGPQVKIWKKSGRVLGTFAAFDDAQVGDYDLAAGDVDGDGKDEIAVMRMESGRPAVRVLSAVTGQVAHAFPVGIQDDPATLAMGDVDGDGKAELLVITGGQPRMFVYDGEGKLLSESAVSAAGYLGLARAAVGSFGMGRQFIAVLPVQSGADVRPTAPKYIEVDISEQRLRAYEYGRLVRSTLVATGLVSMPTPIGDFSITDKPYKVWYKAYYGPGNPNNYDFGLVTWNLRFLPHTYLHYAPWRSKFGVRGSHGCVNLSKADAEWIYGWAEVGTPVSIKK